MTKICSADRFGPFENQISHLLGGRPRFLRRHDGHEWRLNDAATSRTVLTLHEPTLRFGERHGMSA